MSEGMYLERPHEAAQARDKEKSMKRFVWIMTTACTLTCTGFVLANSSWFQTRSPSSRSAIADNPPAEDICSSEAAWRWGHCQPTHWRACILQRP